MPSPSYTYTLTNGTNADASKVSQNFTDILNGVTDGTKDLSINALTCAGTATFNGNVAIGNATSDTLTVTASLASDIVPSTAGVRALGSATYPMGTVYIGDTGGDSVAIVSANMSADRTYTLPEVSADASFVMTQGAQTIVGVKTFSSGVSFGSSTLANYVASGSFTPTLKGSSSNPTLTYTTQTGEYTRVGNVVFLTVLITTNSISVAGTGSAYIDVSGIGINSNASSTKRYMFAHRGVTYSHPASVTYVQGEMTAASTIYLSGAGSGASGDIDVSAIGNGDSIFLTGFYFV